MYRSALILLSISFVLASCSSIGPASSEPGQAANQMPRPTLEIAPAPLNELANRAEALSPILDIYQITLRDDGDLIVFTFMRLSETSDNPTQDLRESTEAIWQAAMQADIDLSQVSVTFLRTQNVVSLDYGPTRAAWLVGGIRADWDEISGYLTGPRTPASEDSFWNSGELVIVPFDQAFTGQPNHPLLPPEE